MSLRITLFLALFPSAADSVQIDCLQPNSLPTDFLTNSAYIENIGFRPVGGLDCVHLTRFKQQSSPFFALNTLRYTVWPVCALLVEKSVGPFLG